MVKPGENNSGQSVTIFKKYMADHSQSFDNINTRNISDPVTMLNNEFLKRSTSSEESDVQSRLVPTTELYY